MLPAGNGDSLLVEYGSERPRHVLVDGGTVGTWKVLGPRLEALAPRGLELLVVTHVDNDHTEGVVKLLGAPSLPCPIADVWFNGWPELTAATRPLGPLEGEFISALIQRSDMEQNKAFGGRPILAAEEGPLETVELDGKLEVTILSPTLPKLRLLVTAWASALKKKKLVPGDARAALQQLQEHRKLRPRALGKLSVEELVDVASDIDKKAANASSIAFLAEFDGRRLLLAGDATPDVLEPSILRLTAQLGERRLRLDAFKLPHHGSERNVTDALLAAVDCPRYLFSTDGKTFGHPDEVAVARVLGANRGRRDLTLCFNYRTEQNERWADAAEQRKWSYRAEYPGAGEDGFKILL
jgi:beta-lactamase superfamily II metal-dependent hydrolase